MDWTGSSGGKRHAAVPQTVTIPHRGQADDSRFLREKPFRDMIFRKDMMNKRPGLYSAGRRPA